MDTLAAAYAEAGRFNEAVKTQTEVVDLLKHSNMIENIPACRERLKLYESQKPYRED